MENNRFAVVHERESEDASAAAEKLTADIAKATGITLEAASIDPRVANLSDADNLRALAYSLQRFAEGSDDFTVEKLAEDPDALLGDTRDRVVKFRKLLKESAFSLVYQPIVRLKDGSTSHFEALSRFDQSFAELSPFQIICFAEEVGLIGDYDLAVLNRAVNKLRSIQGSNLPSLAVNVSGRSLSDMKILNEIERSLDAASDLVDNIVLEITESAKIEDLETLGERLEKIRAHGFKVYLDDFGAGASGFQYLRRLKVDAIKIDGEYVREATTRSDDRAFLRAMVGLCKDLNITTVGEWVESRDHAVMLRKIGVDYGQGYYFGKPSIGLNARRIEV